MQGNMTGRPVLDISLLWQVPVLFIQCKGPEARTAASWSISRQHAAVSSTDEGDDNEPSTRRGRTSGTSGSSSSSSGVGGGGGSGSVGSGGYSYFNAAEASVVVDCLQKLLGAGMQPVDMCVITPYR